MHSAFKPVIRTVILYLLSVLAIASVIVAGKFVLEGIAGARSAHDYLQTINSVQDEVARYRRDGPTALTQRMRGGESLLLEELDRRIQGVNHKLQLGAPNEEGDLQAFLRLGSEQFAGRLGARYKAELERELWKQELAYLLQIRAHLMVRRDRAAAHHELERLRRHHIAVYGKLRQKQREITQLGFIDTQRMKYPWARGPALDKLKAELAALSIANGMAAAAFKTQETALRGMRSAGPLREFAIDHARLDQAVQPLEARVLAASEAVFAHWASRIATPLLQALPLACGILLLCLLAKFAVRIVFYFVLAPLATRGPPVQLGGAGSSHGSGKAAAAIEAAALSAVSQAIRLGADEELLALPRYLQSTPVGAVKTTRWLLKGRKWASLVSGMYLLTCVRTDSRDEQIVLSASDDGLSELALIRIPASSALVFQPRALVGLICSRNTPLNIERRWRLASLHAWLTLQLRYFVIHGPVTLVLRGTRGIRVERASGANSVRQSATLGFSADVAYSTIRSAPFLPYLRGQTELLYDRFAGGDGVYIYDETPEMGRRGGRPGRGLEGLTDAVFKVFGY